MASGFRRFLSRSQPAEAPDEDRPDPLERLAELGRQEEGPHPAAQNAHDDREAATEPRSLAPAAKESAPQVSVAESRRVGGRRPGYVWLSQRSRQSLFDKQF